MRRVAAGPVAPQDRILAIDTLRGIALFGVVAINVVTEFRVSIFERFLPGPPASWLDRAIDTILMIGVDSKAFALFSFLFGVGLGIQFDRLAGNLRRLWLLLRRLFALLIIGFLHVVFIWNGDILVEYALAGLLVLPFLLGSTRVLTAAVAIALGLYFVGPLLPFFPSLPSKSWMARHIAQATEVYGSGGFVDVLSFRVREVPAIVPLHVMVFPRTLALMLLGVVAWRSGVFEKRLGTSRMLARGAVLGIAVGAAMAIAVASRSLGSGIWIAERMSTVLLAGGYAATIIWIVNYGRGGRWLLWAAPVGRIAFTNYLTQSIIFGWIFYGYGLGLFGHLGVSAALAIGVGVYVGQAVFSALWLQRYAFGPIEWVWRSAMYGRVQAFRRRSSLLEGREAGA
jgi:uncharacterized protein